MTGHYSISWGIFPLAFWQVIHQFDAQADGELSIAVGEYVVVRQVHDLLYLLTLKFFIEVVGYLMVKFG